MTTKEGGTIFEGGFIDNDLGSFGLDALHDALDGTLAEIVGVALHGEAIDTDGDIFLSALTPVAIGGIVAGLAEHLVGNEVLTGTIALDNGGHHVLGHVGIVGQELLGVLRQAVAAIAKRRVVIVGADTGVETDARDDCLGVEALDLGIGVELVEVADAKSEVGVGEELNCFGLCHSHQEGIDTLLDGSFLKEIGEGLRIFLSIGIADGGNGGILLVPLLTTIGGEHLGVAHDDARGIEVVVKGLALAEELGREEEVERLSFEGWIGQELQGVLDVQASAIAHRDGALDDHHSIGIDTEHEVDDILDMVGVEEVLLGVIVRGGRNDDKVGILIG